MATKREYISKLQKRADKVSAPFSEKGLKRRRCIWIAFGMSVIGSLGLGMLGTINEQKRAYNKYLADNQEINFEYLGYEDTFTRWNKNDLGNDVNVLLSGGKLYSKDNLTIAPRNNSYEVILDGKIMSKFDENISYINVMNDKIFFRDDTTRKLYSYDIETKKKEVLSKDNCGEVFVTNDKVYYLSFTDNSAIACVNLDGSEKQIIVDEPVANFIICGNSVIYLTNTQRLYQYLMKDNTHTMLVGKVERFFVNGDLIIESSDIIFSCNTNGNKAKELYKSEEPSLRLTSAAEDEIIFQKNGKLYSLPLDGSAVKEIHSEECELYLSVIRHEDSYSLLAYQDSQNFAVDVSLIEASVR